MLVRNLRRRPTRRQASGQANIVPISRAAIWALGALGRPKGGMGSSGNGRDRLVARPTGERRLEHPTHRRGAPAGVNAKARIGARLATARAISLAAAGTAVRSSTRRSVMNTPSTPTRNPFGVQDAPEPDGADVTDFAARVDLTGAADDPNARAWCGAGGAEAPSIAGNWSSRWNGGVDGTIAGDTADRWKPGKAEVKLVGDRVYVSFDWGNGARRALIDARRRGSNRLVGRYINLSDPTITRPWVGLIVDNRRIDGRWTNGRLDFRR
jgi:hypothetical protein